MNVTELFASLVFNDEAMLKYLSKETYAEYKECVSNGTDLSRSLADRMAKGMMNWAIDNGCTHYTHWFQPMTGITAEKHDSFISPVRQGEIKTEFKGKELIKGEPDASSFPSGGLRATFEARGYTAWDPTSYAFIKDGILCIPTAFCSYNGEALDKKTPLLRSMESLNKETLRLLKIFKKTDVKKVISNAGPEQEYFLVDRAMYKMRPDLMFTGRTLFGARSPKGQELDDHYYGAVKLRVVAYMKDLDNELWKLGVYAKTKHNEVAPAQHELAAVYTDTNLATDHNQLVMEMMRKVAAKHGFKCILHEKPFEGVNGSGKHNNWSISTDTGINLLNPGDNPSDNMLFLVTLCAVINAVDKHQDLLRVSVASADNDHRLGKFEAPPAVISIFLGDELLGVLDAIAEDRNYSKRANCEIKIGVKGLPKFSQDDTDRNRTSPFAFTGTKFEFRMPGSKQSVAGVNTVINTIVADEIGEIANKLASYKNLTIGVTDIVKDTIKNHKRIIFNGNGYSEEWIEEAKKRGLLNLATTVDALPYINTEENVALFEKHGVYTRNELNSRLEIYTESYCKKLHIEALTMSDMTKSLFLPAVTTYLNELADTANKLGKLGINIDNMIIEDLSNLYDETIRNEKILEDLVLEIDGKPDDLEKAKYYKEKVIPAMNDLRKSVDGMELLTAKKYWPVPTYADLLTSESSR